MKERAERNQFTIKLEIKEMPTKEVLEGFLNGMNGESQNRVVFDVEKGKFISQPVVKEEKEDGK